MKKILLLMFPLILVLWSCGNSSSMTLDREVEKRITELMSDMTLEEKCDQLRNNDHMTTADNNRLGIPGFKMADGPHGINWSPSTSFPVGIAMTSTWDRELLYRTGEAMGAEFRSHGRNQALGPCTDIQRDPRNGRTPETGGEDPYLAGQINVAITQGIQSQGVIATIKHFAANNHQRDRHSSDHQIDERTMMEFYGLPFKMAVQEADVLSVMNSYNLVNHKKAAESSWLLTEILRDYWGYKYYVVSDWGAVWEADKAVNAGTDICMGSDHYENLEELVEKGDVSMDVIDEAVRRVLRTKIDAGMLDNPPISGERDLEASRQVALEVAQEGIILLKNENNILPLDSSIQSVALIGPNANVMPQDGRGSSYVAPMNAVSTLDGLRNQNPDLVINYARGCDINRDDTTGFQEALDAAANSDLVIFVGGLDNTQEGEEGEGILDRKLDRVTRAREVELPGQQQPLINALAEVNENVVVVLVSGGLCSVNRSIDNIDGLLYAFYPGVEGGNAIADIIYGEVNPSGKLPVTMPLDRSQFQSFNDLDFTGDHIDGIGYRRFDALDMEPLFPFGYGMSYTNFEYSNFQMTSGELSGKDNLTFTVDITNTGDVIGQEIVQLYVSHNDAAVPMAEKQLKAFDKVELAPGETTTVELVLTPMEFTYWHEEEDHYYVQEGSYTVKVGPSSAELPLTMDIQLTGDYMIPHGE